jgi:sirohydrochlorin ferrochelatase
VTNHGSQAERGYDDIEQAAAHLHGMLDALKATQKA